MSDTLDSNSRPPQAWAKYVLGLVVFLLGIGLMLLAFFWGYHSLEAFDAQLNRVQEVQAVPTPATPDPGGGKAGSGDSSSQAGKPPAEVAQAEPSPGPGLGTVAAAAGVRLLTLLVLAGIGAMIASRGAQLASSSPR